MVPEDLCSALGKEVVVVVLRSDIHVLGDDPEVCGASKSKRISTRCRGISQKCYQEILIC